METRSFQEIVEDYSVNSPGFFTYTAHGGFWETTKLGELLMDFGNRSLLKKGGVGVAYHHWNLLVVYTISIHFYIRYIAFWVYYLILEDHLPTEPEKSLKLCHLLLSWLYITSTNLCPLQKHHIPHASVLRCVWQRSSVARRGDFEKCPFWLLCVGRLCGIPPSK